MRQNPSCYTCAVEAKKQATMRTIEHLAAEIDVASEIYLNKKLPANQLVRQIPNQSDYCEEILQDFQIVYFIDMIQVMFLEELVVVIIR